MVSPTRPQSLNEVAYRKDILDTCCIQYLYYLAHVDNAESIFRHGILSHTRVQQLGPRDISLREVNDRRASVPVGGRLLHDYAPLYFNPKNPMLSKRRDLQDEIVILCVDPNLVFIEGVFFADGNAASDTTSFFENPSDLKGLDWRCIRGKYWNDFHDGKRKRCAEVLVPDQVAPGCIRQVVVRNQATLGATKRARDSAIEQSSRRFPVEIDADLYF